MDASSGVTNEIYNSEKIFVKELGRYFNINPAGPRGSVVQYASTPRTLVDFADPAFIGKIEDSLPIGSPRRIDRALGHAANLLQNQTGGKIVILLAAGKQSPGAKPLTEAVQLLRSLNAATYVVAIGNGLNNGSLLSVVEQPRGLYTVPYGDLKRRTRSIALSGK